MTVHAHSGSRVTSTLGRLPFWSWTVIWLALCVGGAALWHWQAHGVVNAWQLCLSLFLAINIATCLHEIALGLRISTIEAWHHDPERRVKQGLPPLHDVDLRILE